MPINHGKWESFNQQGGNLWITNTEIFFKPHALNFGGRYIKFMKISDFVSLEKTQLVFNEFLIIKDKNGNFMKLKFSYRIRDEVISAIEKRKDNLIN